MVINNRKASRVSGEILKCQKTKKIMRSQADFVLKRDLGFYDAASLPDEEKLEVAAVWEAMIGGDYGNKQKNRIFKN